MSKTTAATPALVAPIAAMLVLDSTPQGQAKAEIAFRQLDKEARKGLRPAGISSDIVGLNGPGLAAAAGVEYVKPVKSWGAKDTAELLAEAQAKVIDHTAQLAILTGALTWLQGAIATAPESVKPGIQDMLESQARKIAQRNEWLAIQQGNVVKHGGQVTKAPAKSTRRTKAAA